MLQGIKEPRLLEKIILQNSSNPNIILEKETVSLFKGCIPLKYLMDKWNIKDPVWADGDLELDCTPEGLSEMAFTAMKVVRLKGTKK